MNYVDSLNLFGVEARQTSCIKINGAPTATTEGAVGVLAIDVDSENKDVYKCIAVNEDGTYEWELFSSGLQADWNQTDETKLDYIKNKTHYHIPGYSILHEVGTVESWQQGWYSCILNEYEVGAEYEFLLNDEIKGTVIFDQPIEEYPTVKLTDNCQITVFDPLVRLVDLGGSDIHGKDFSLKIYKPETLVQLDEKYIPDTIARKTDIENGVQVQSDWSQNNETAPDYVKNRPFYTESPAFYFNYEEDLKGSVEFEYSNKLKKSELEPEKTYRCKGSYRTADNDGGAIDELYTAILQEDGTIRLSDDVYFTLIDDPINKKLILFSEEGTLINITITKSAENFKLIPDEYLPEYVFNKNKIITWEEVRNKPLLPEINENGSTYFGNSFKNPEEGFEPGENAFSAGYGCQPTTANSQSFGYYTSIGIKGYKIKEIIPQLKNSIRIILNSNVDNDTNTGCSTAMTNGVKIYALTYQSDIWQLIEIGQLERISAVNNMVMIALIENCPNLGDITTTPMIFLETPRKTELQPGCLGDVMAQGPDVMYLTPEQVTGLGKQGIKISSAKIGHTEGYFTYIGGNYAHAQNNRCRAIGNSSDAGGQETWARGGASMTRGEYTQTMPGAAFSFARGKDTICHGACTEASGLGNEAYRDTATVRGKYATLDTAKKYLDMVGNGTSATDRKNIYTLSKDGVLWVPKEMRVGGASQDDEAAQTVATLADLSKITPALPENLVYEEDLANFATKDDIDTILLEIINAQKEIVGGEL